MNRMVAKRGTAARSDVGRFSPNPGKSASYVFRAGWARSLLWGVAEPSLKLETARQEEENMVAKKSTAKKESKPKVRKETLRDLDVRGKDAGVKGGQKAGRAITSL